MRVFEAVQAAILQYAMLPTEGKIVLGLSGGADSMTLFTFFCSVPAYKKRLLCAHVHHGIRGAEADRDADFVRAQCEKQGVPLQVLHINVPALCAQTGEGEEECGRRVRYVFFHGLAAGENDRIVTAHNADDQAETVLLHMTRGAGLQGLGGMAPVSGKRVRPLLFTSRAEIEALCAGQNIPFVTDATNFTDFYARNRVRHHVLPALREMNPQVLQAFAHLAQTATEDNDYLSSQAAAVFTDCLDASLGVLRAERLLALPVPIGRRVLGQYLQKNGAEPSFTVLQTALQPGFTAMAVPAEEKGTRVFLRQEQGCFLLVRENSLLPWEKSVSLGETSLPDGKILRLTVEKKENYSKIHNFLFKNGLDCAIIQSIAAMRVGNAQPGEKILLPGQKQPQTLYRLYAAQKLLPSLRKTRLVLRTDGEILWAQGLGAAKSAALSPQKNEGKFLLITVLSE